MFIIVPSAQIDIVLQIAFAVIVLAAAFVLRQRQKNLGLGMIVGWGVFILFPIIWVIALGFSDNLT